MIFDIIHNYVKNNPRNTKKPQEPTPSNTKVTKENGPIWSVQSRFLDASLVRETDGKLKKHDCKFCHSKIEKLTHFPQKIYKLSNAKSCDPEVRIFV